jgi:Tfp pilus assembly protein PilE
MLKLFRFIFTSVTLALLISGCGSSSFQIQDSLSIKEGHHQYGLWWLKSRKLGSTHVRSDKIYVGKGRVYRSVQGKVYYAQIFPTWKAKTDWQPNFRAGKGFTLLSFSQEMCKKFGIDDLSKVDGCAKYKNYLFVRDISAFGLFDGASNLQYVDATQELNYLLQKISLHDFTFMQDRGSKQFVKLMIDSDVINNTITKELNEEHIQNYHAFAIKYLPKKSYTPYAYNKKMRYFHFMHNYDNVLKNGKLSEVQRLLSDAKGQVKKIKNGKSKVRKLQKREHSLLLKSKNIREIEKFYAKNKKYKDINRHLLKLYRASHTFENSLKAYKISHSLKDLDTAYALAKTEKRVKKVDKLLSKAHKLKTSKNIKKLSAFIK